MVFVDYIELFRKRLTELRQRKGVSARDMSLSLGQSESYINKIENGRSLPSFAGFITSRREPSRRRSFSTAASKTRCWQRSLSRRSKSCRPTKRVTYYKSLRI